MDEIIKNLYRGTLFPAEEYCEVNNKEIKHLSSMLNKTVEELRKHLTQRTLELLDRAIELLNEISTKNLEELFVKGFKLGLKITAEAFIK